MRAVLSSHALLIGLATPAVWPYRSIIVVASAACVREIGRFPRDCRSKPSEGRHDDETSSSVTIGISAQDKMDTAYCPSRRARRDTYDRLEMWPRLPSSLASARGVYVRGGAGDTAPKAPMFKQRAVNRKPVPAAEAVSRYPNLKTPGGLVRLLDYVGTVSFAMSGTATAGMRGMNILGCLMVGVVSATGGGTLRDLFLGQSPVFWLVEVEYLGICVTTALCTFVLWPILSRVTLLSHMGTGMDGWLSQAIDTIGLASFCIAGTQQGIRQSYHPLVTIVICCVTCSGGGIMRDIMTSSPVLVLSSHAQMYVSTTAIGSAAYLLARRESNSALLRISAGFWVVVFLRVLASVYNLRLPTMV